MPSGAVIRYDGKRGVVWRIKYADAEGKQVMETLGPEREGWTEKKAKAELRERLVRVERRGWRKPAPLTFSAYADAWTAECKRRRNWRPRTALVNEGAVERLRSYFGPLRLASIRPRDVADFIKEALADYAPATVNLDVCVLCDIYNTALREELVDANPALRVERPRIPRRRWRILEPVEVARVAKAFTDEQARVAFLTLVLTGLRRSEFQALRWRDVDLVENVLRVRDSKTEDGIRSIALSPTLAEELWQHRRRSAFQGEDELVFHHPEKGTTYEAKTFSAALRAALKAAGVEGYVRAFHDLRHTAITNDAASGSNPIAVMSKAGHSDMKTTKRYLHLAGVVFRDEAEALERRLLGTGANGKASGLGELGLAEVPAKE
jgi:integrase